MKTLIKNATVVLPQGLAQTNVLIDGPRIARIDPAPHTRVDDVVDATGLHLLPGVIDDQVHFREPGMTHKEDLHTATRACAKGGVTTFLEMPNTVPTTITQARLEEKLALAAGKCLVNYGFYIGATPHNLDELRRAHRTPGIKIFIGSSTGDLLVDDQEALERIFAETTLPITAHCEDETTIRRNRERIGPTSDLADHSRIRDVEAAVVATRRAIDLALRHRHRFHVLHVSTGAEAKILGDLRKGADQEPSLDVGRSTLDVGRSAPSDEHRTSNIERRTSNASLITAEVCPHHLFFNVDDYARLGTRVQMNPSLKTADDNARLWKAPGNGGHPGDRHRPRAAHAGGEGEALSAVSLRPARRGKLAGPHAERGERRADHDERRGGMDVRPRRPACGTSSARAASPKATTPTWCWSIWSFPEPSATKNRKRSAAGALGMA